ncbi:NAD(P)-dependent oxidoreductase [Geodermatophilus sp. SYSU D00697]
MSTHRVAVLDDHQSVAAEFADWSRVPEPLDVVAFADHLDDEDALVERLAPFDVVATVHLVLGEGTRGIVGRAELGRMKPTAILVNTSRGPVVDEAALVEALSDGRIAGAGLDVYDREPLPADSPLRSAPRTVLTPHLGYVTRRGYEVFYREVVEDVAAFMAGSPVRVLDPA